jgi:penicillin-binding protein 1B
MKPFVFLSAFLNSDEITPTTEILDEKQIYEYEGQKWAPENYDKKFYGAVPMYFALKNSLNAATANLGMQAGLEKIIQTAQSLGVESEMKAFPSLTLGAFELYASEVAQSYLTLARFGRYQKISFVESVLSSEGELVFERELQSEERLSPQKVAMLVGMMRQTLLTGTAKSLQSLNLASEVAGKTGTTSDHKDAWFAGFSPHLLAVAWIGFDDNTPTKLTGSSGPAPIWGQFMKNTESFYSAAAFQWPQNTQKTENPDERQAFDPPDYLIFSN